MKIGDFYILPWSDFYKAQNPVKIIKPNMTSWRLFSALQLWQFFVYKGFSQKFGVYLPSDLLYARKSSNVKIYEFNWRFICEKPTAFLPLPHAQPE